MEEKRERQGEGQGYALRELVWAKITGFPWWPARITQTPHPDHPFYRVDFFSDNTHAFLDCSKIAKYDDLGAHIDRGRPMSKGLKRAIAEADQLWEQQQVLRRDVEPAEAAVEAVNLNQKQLLQLPLLPAHLQENILTDEVVQNLDISSGLESLDSSSHLQLPTVVFTKQQRMHYVSQLLKKYRLSTLPKIQQIASAKPNLRNGCSKLRRKRLNRPTQAKRRLTKNSPDQHTLSFMLTRKIWHLLKSKEGLSLTQTKQISLSLSRQLTAGSLDPQEVTRLFKWLSISTPDTIANFYQNWGSLQSDKEKPSYMTTED